MVLFVRITIIYLVAGAAVVTLFRDNPAVLLTDIAQRMPTAFRMFVNMALWAVPATMALVMVVPMRELLARLPRAAVAFFGCTIFFLVFTMLKTTLPFILPFWADPYFADLDRMMHFGTDPWRIAHRLSPWIDAEWGQRIYFTWWGMPALYLPTLLVLFDGDRARIRRYVLLYAFAWIGLGNVLALAFLSAGPVYYDRLFDPDYFAALQPVLHSTGVSTGYMGTVQEWLWATYVSGGQEAGTGISAFPSVHVGMIAVLGLYLWERWRFMLPVSIAMVVVYEFFSVYLGWHYAVDGYASVLIIVALWAWLRRPSRVRDADLAFQAAE